MLSGCFAVSVFLFILYRMELSRLMPVIGALVAVLTSVVGFAYFGEQIKTVKITGLYAVATGIVLLTI